MNPEEFFEDTTSKNTSTTQGANGFFALQPKGLAGDREMKIDLLRLHSLGRETWL